jgi:hypothetical protein
VDEELDVCWNCGTSRDGVPDPAFETQQASYREVRRTGLRPTAGQLSGLVLAILAAGALYLLARYVEAGPRGRGWLGNAPAQAAVFAACLAAAYIAIRRLFHPRAQALGTAAPESVGCREPRTAREDVWTCPDCGATNPVEFLRCWKCAPPQRGDHPGEPVRSVTSDAERAESQPRGALWLCLSLAFLAFIILAPAYGVYVVYREISAQPQDAEVIWQDIGQVAVTVVILAAISGFVWFLRRRP